MAERIDIHQHVWTEPLIEALGRRDSPPFARPANGRFVLYASGEAPATVAVGPNAVDCRLAVLGGVPLVRQFGPGQTFDFAASDIHRVLHVGDEAAVTLHAYSLPLWRMGAYAVREDGVLARHSVSYAEELYPL
jgi:hypothetical protein